MAQVFTLHSVNLIGEEMEPKQIRFTFWQQRVMSKMLKSIFFFVAAFCLCSAKASATENAPNISPSYQVFSSGPQTVTITDSDGSAVIHFTTDGTTVTTTSPTYSSPFAVSATTTIQALAVGTGGTSAITTSIVQIDPITASVPRTNLLLWHKADNGAITSGSSAVTSWIDVTGNGNNAAAGNSPTLVTNAINGLPSIAFNGNNNVLNWPNAFSTLGPGASIFVVCNPQTSAAGALCSLGNAFNRDALDFWQTAGSSLSLYSYNGSTQSSVTGSGALNLNNFQILEGVHNGSGTATLYQTGTQVAQNTAMQNLNNVSRSDSYIGSYYNGGTFSGQIAEILLYSAPLSDADRHSVENYLWARYVNPPTISPNLGVFSSTQTVTITGTVLGTVRYTLDGTNPVSTSPIYSGPFVISASTTIKAVEFTSTSQSAVSTVYLQKDATTANIPRSGLMVWQKADYGVSTTGGGVTNWLDVSGNNLPLTLTSGYTSPTLRSNVVNGLPVVTFDGVANGLQWPSGFSDLTAGFSMFVSCRPYGQTSGIISAIGNTSSDQVIVWPFWADRKPLYLFVTSSSFATTYLTNQVQNMEFIHNGAGVVNYFNNGLFITQSTAMNNLANVLRTENFMGAFRLSNYFNGDVAEFLFYNRPVTISERQNIEAYLASRYLGPIPSAPAAPIFSLAAGTLSAPTELGISCAPGGSVFFTTDGTVPSASSPKLTTALQIDYSQTVKAISIVNGVSSAVSTAVYNLDSTKYPSPSSSDTSVLQINLQSPSPAQ